ncbi:hypothetical protein [Pseudoalteromonas sp. Of7M-16]|uniref:hypothetical protein n=1 Tax=Pseudoalteromonas sp. Of7M-16 TaxID=2917756 RepID=UPI001EF6A0C2|nr:hypothetical protein [Pseudoalteromonas sp. Of7M-16]MCG7551158.1 hypothetical protein [Pseudoalteromonas sp. Of7M-16]
MVKLHNNEPKSKIKDGHHLCVDMTEQPITQATNMATATRGVTLGLTIHPERSAMQSMKNR